jgi:hypothetical protein
VERTVISYFGFGVLTAVTTVCAIFRDVCHFVWLDSCMGFSPSLKKEAVRAAAGTLVDVCRTTWRSAVQCDVVFSVRGVAHAEERVALQIAVLVPPSIFYCRDLLGRQWKAN